MDSFYELEPDQILNATEQWNLRPTGQFTQLNSFENRVFDIKLENQDSVVLKVYRPGRWTEAQILEEHSYCQHLVRLDIPSIAPIPRPNGATLYSFEDLFYSVWPKVRGRLPEEWSDEQATSVGRQIASFHNAAQAFEFVERPVFAQNAALDFFEVLKWVAPEVKHRYRDAGEVILENFEMALECLDWLAIHGDLHRGNLIEWKMGDASDQKVTFLDLDDSSMGPPEQDLWMLILDNPHVEHPMLKGYQEFRELDVDRFVSLVPLFRGHRIIRYSAWISKRWDDPFFRATFPQFREYSFWAEEVEALEKIAWTWRNE